MIKKRAHLLADKSQTRKYDLFAAVGLLGLLLITNGGALFDGVFLDDHWQRAAAGEYGWGFNDLIESATIDFSGRWNHLWWQDRPLVWRYARPVAMLVIKLEYHLAGGNPIAIHAFGLAWHFLAAWLVYRLAMWAKLERKWAFLAGAIFIIHPHSTTTVGWTAARNALVNGCFFAAAVLTYGRASIGSGAQPTPSGKLRFLPPIILWALALLSRETGIIFPLVILLLDVSFGGWRHFRRRLPLHIVVWVLSLAFLYWRLVIFSVEAVPTVYFSRPEGLMYLPWAISKMINLLFSLVIYTPMVMGLSTYYRGLSVEHLWPHVAIAVVMAAVLFWYLRASRDIRGRWFWLVWLVAGFAPVIPVFAAPHFAYLPCIPYAIMLAMMLKALPGWWRPAVTTLVIAATLWSIGVYRFAFRGVVRSEQLIYADIFSTTSRPEPGSRVFLINLPIVGAYTPLVLRQAWNIQDLEGYTLTLADHPLMMTRASAVEVINDHELVVSMSGPGYFSGIVGEMFMRVFRSGLALKIGTVIKGEMFDTTVLEADETGVGKLKFSFGQPLASKNYYFYVSSPARPAYRLRFEDTDHAGRYPAIFAQGGSTLSAEDRRWQNEHAAMLAERRYIFRIMQVVAGVVHSDLFLTGDAEKP